jgi:hypothetical protein
MCNLSAASKYGTEPVRAYSNKIQVDTENNLTNVKIKKTLQRRV